MYFADLRNLQNPPQRSFHSTSQERDLDFHGKKYWGRTIDTDANLGRDTALSYGRTSQFSQYHYKSNLDTIYHESANGASPWEHLHMIGEGVYCTLVTQGDL